MITEVNIILIKPKNGLLGFASVVLDEKIYLGSIGIHSKLDGSGLRLTYPTKKIGDSDLNIFHPINRALSKEIEEAIFNQFKKVMTKVNDRYNNPSYETGGF